VLATGLGRSTCSVTAVACYANRTCANPATPQHNTTQRHCPCTRVAPPSPSVMRTRTASLCLLLAGTWVTGPDSATPLVAGGGNNSFSSWGVTGAGSNRQQDSGREVGAGTGEHMSVVAPAPACSVHCVDAMYRLLPGVPGAATPRPLTAPVAAARGELVHLQVVVSVPGGPTHPSTVVAAVEGVPAEAVTVRQVAYTHLNVTLAPLTNRPGMYSDALVPLVNGSLPGAVSAKPGWRMLSPRCRRGRGKSHCDRVCPAGPFTPLPLSALPLVLRLHRLLPSCTRFAPYSGPAPAASALMSCCLIGIIPIMHCPSTPWPLTPSSHCPWPATVASSAAVEPVLSL